MEEHVERLMKGEIGDANDGLHPPRSFASGFSLTESNATNKGVWLQ